MRGLMAYSLGIALLAAPALAQPREQITIGMSEFPADMHPFITNLLVRNYVLGAARRAVFRYDDKGQVICQLCTEVPTAANGRAKLVTNGDGSAGMEVTFTLREGLKWADGVALTTRDIALGYEVEKVFAPPASVVGIDIIDAQSYRVRLKTPRYDFDRLTPAPIAEHVEGAIFASRKDPLDYGQRSAFNRAPETPGLWNGPFRITGFKPNESVTMERNPTWDGAGPYFKRVTFRFIENTSALQAALLAGDIDTVYGLTLDQALALEKRESARFDVSFIPAISTNSLYVQLDNPILADIRVRRAIIQAIDRQTLVNRLYEGKVPVADSVLSPVEKSRDPNVKHWKFDQAAARALLAEAGWKPGPDGILVQADGTRLSLDLNHSSGIRVVELVGQVVQSQLKAVGIELVIRAEPVRVLLGETVRKRQFKGLAMFNWTPAPDGIPYFTYHSSRVPSAENSYTGTNYMGLRDPTMDALLDGAIGEIDPVKRQVLWNGIQGYIAENLPIIPLHHGTNIFVAPKWLAGLTPMRSVFLPPLWIEAWKVK
jgi:peptide/nickel transport system substrate-binding protein